MLQRIQSGQDGGKVRMETPPLEANSTLRLLPQHESFTIVVVEVYYVVEILLTHHPILVQTSKQNSSLASFSTQHIKVEDGLYTTQMTSWRPPFGS